MPPRLRIPLLALVFLSSLLAPRAAAAQPGGAESIVLANGVTVTEVQAREVTLPRGNGEWESKGYIWRPTGERVLFRVFTAKITGVQLAGYWAVHAWVQQGGRWDIGPALVSGRFVANSARGTIQADPELGPGGGGLVFTTTTDPDSADVTMQEAGFYDLALPLADPVSPALPHYRIFPAVPLERSAP